MNTVTLTVDADATHTPAASESFVWLKEGWQLFAKKPFTLFGFVITLLIVEGLFQLLPGPPGMVISKFAMVMLAASIWPMLDNINKNGTFSFKGIASYNGWSGLPALSLVLLVPFMVQVLVAFLLLGGNGIDLFLNGSVQSVSQIQVAVIFASATPVSMAIVFLPACALLTNTSAKNAVVKGLQLSRQAWRPLTVLMLLNGVALFAAPFTFALSAVVFSPLLMCANYCAFKRLTHPYLK